MDATVHPTGGDQVTDVPDLTRLDLREPDSTRRIADALHRQGMAVFCGVSDRAGLLRAGHSLMTIRIHRDSDGEGVTTIERRFSGRDGQPCRVHRAGTGATHRRVRGGGAAAGTHADVRPAAANRWSGRAGGRLRPYREIAESDPAMLDALRAPRSAYFGGGFGRHRTAGER